MLSERMQVAHPATIQNAVVSAKTDAEYIDATNVLLSYLWSVHRMDYFGSRRFDSLYECLSSDITLRRPLVDHKTYLKF